MLYQVVIKTDVKNPWHFNYRATITCTYIHLTICITAYKSVLKSLVCKYVYTPRVHVYFYLYIFELFAYESNSL